MQTFDPKVPLELKRMQSWFGQVISSPLGPNLNIAKYGPNQCQMSKEAARFVVQSKTLKPEQRVEIYNQQYWYRLINTLQDFYPFLVRLFSFNGFNETLAIPYLRKHPPCHWSLNELGNKLPDWIKTHYKQEDRRFVFDSAQLDLAFLKIFFCRKTAFPEDKTEEFLEKPLKLQPHVSLHSHPYHLFEFRQALMEQSPDYWIDNPFPELPKGEFHCCLFRNHFSQITWKELSQAEFLLLKEIEKGATIDNLCDFLESQEKAIQTEAENSLEAWFKHWTLHSIIELNPDAK